jgi:hypothetical protein
VEKRSFGKSNEGKMMDGMEKFFCSLRRKEEITAKRDTNFFE